MKEADDGAAYDPSATFDAPAASTCGGMWTDGWFLTGHGNGGTFMNVPTGLGGQAPSQTEAAAWYFYGTPGPCTHCGGPGDSPSVVVVARRERGEARGAGAGDGLVLRVVLDQRTASCCLPPATTVSRAAWVARISAIADR